MLQGHLAMAAAQVRCTLSALSLRQAASERRARRCRAQMLFGVYNVFCQQALSGIPMLSFGLWRWMLSLPIIYLRVRGQPPADRVQPVRSAEDAANLVAVAFFGFFGCSVRMLLRLCSLRIRQLTWAR